MEGWRRRVRYRLYRPLSRSDWCVGFIVIVGVHLLSEMSVGVSIDYSVPEIPRTLSYRPDIVSFWGTFWGTATVFHRSPIATSRLLEGEIKRSVSQYEQGQGN